MGAYKHLAVFVFLATFTVAVQGEIIIDHELLALTSKLQDHHLNYETNELRRSNLLTPTVQVAPGTAETPMTT